MPLSGFAARCDKLFDAVYDPLHVRALAVREERWQFLLLVYDLLALGPELQGEILAALKRESHVSGCETDILLCTTHTHSAPGAIELLGCGTCQRDYWDFVVSRSVAAVTTALRGMVKAEFRFMTVFLPGNNYNRRRVLSNDQVVMARQPSLPIKKSGPAWDRFVFGRFDRPDGTGIAGLVSWAAHPVTVCASGVTADYPGELCRRLEEQEGFPFLYLQGCCGDLNPLFRKMTHPEMRENVGTIMKGLGRLDWAAAVRQDGVRSPAHRTLPLAYAPLESRESLRALCDGMRGIAETGAGPDSMTRILADILNIEPGTDPDPELMRYIASILNRWGSRLLEQPPGQPPPCPLAVAVWRLGDLILGFVAAELFVETGIALQSRFPSLTVNLVSYAAPLAGYLPTDQALEEGGYEPAYAYRFYNHPAPFARGSEPALREILADMIGDK